MSDSSPKRTKRFEQRYISVAELAVRWSVSLSAIYSGKCGSNSLTQAFMLCTKTVGNSHIMPEQIFT